MAAPDPRTVVPVVGHHGQGLRVVDDNRIMVKMIDNPDITIKELMKKSYKFLSRKAKPVLTGIVSFFLE